MVLLSHHNDCTTDTVQFDFACSWFKYKKFKNKRKKMECIAVIYSDIPKHHLSLNLCNTDTHEMLIVIVDTTGAFQHFVTSDNFSLQSCPAMFFHTIEITPT